MIIVMQIETDTLKLILDCVKEIHLYQKNDNIVYMVTIILMKNESLYYFSLFTPTNRIFYSKHILKSVVNVTARKS